jgi:hypothetical protein
MPHKVQTIVSRLNKATPACGIPVGGRQLFNSSGTFRVPSVSSAVPTRALALRPCYLQLRALLFVVESCRAQTCCRLTSNTSGYEAIGGGNSYDHPVASPLFEAHSIVSTPPATQIFRFQHRSPICWHERAEVTAGLSADAWRVCVRSQGSRCAWRCPSP